MIVPNSDKLMVDLCRLVNQLTHRDCTSSSNSSASTSSSSFTSSAPHPHPHQHPAAPLSLSQYNYPLRPAQAQPSTINQPQHQQPSTSAAAILAANNYHHQQQPPQPSTSAAAAASAAAVNPCECFAMLLEAQAALQHELAAKRSVEQQLAAAVDELHATKVKLDVEVALNGTLRQSLMRHPPPPPPPVIVQQQQQQPQRPQFQPLPVPRRLGKPRPSTSSVVMMVAAPPPPPPVIEQRIEASPRPAAADLLQHPNDANGFARAQLFENQKLKEMLTEEKIIAARTVREMKEVIRTSRNALDLGKYGRVHTPSP